MSAIREVWSVKSTGEKACAIVFFGSSVLAVLFSAWSVV